MFNTPTWTLTDPSQMIHLAISNAGIPIDSVANLNALQAGEEHPPDLHIVYRDDGLIIQVDYRPEATEAQIVQGDNIAKTLNVTPRRVRSPWAVLAEIVALTNNQRDAIAADLTANNRAKIKAFGPPYDAVMLALEWSANTGTVIQTRDAYSRIAALYVQQNIHYLEKPAFAPTVNIVGWEYIPPGEVVMFGAGPPPGPPVTPRIGPFQ